MNTYVPFSLLRDHLAKKSYLDIDARNIASSLDMEANPDLR